MIIAHSRLLPYTLPLRLQWRSGSQAFEARQGWLLELEDTDGVIGYGDCAPLPPHGTETASAACTSLELALRDITGLTPDKALERLPAAGSLPASRCALETALLDLVAQHQELPLHTWLNPASNPVVLANAALGTLDDEVVGRARAVLAQGYRTLKLKVGIADPQQEIGQLQLLCDTLPHGVRLRLDANRSWELVTARSFINQLSGLPIESLEEPLAHPDIEELEQLQGETDITLALDETVAQVATNDLSQLHPLRRIVLKPMLLGGPLTTLRLGQHARALGIESVITSSVDSAAGIWAATQLAAALDSPAELCHGLGTGEWLQRDLGAGPEINHGLITIPSTPGLGFTPYP